jgi:hypothetical protein
MFKDSTLKRVHVSVLICGADRTGKSLLLAQMFQGVPNSQGGASHYNWDAEAETSSSQTIRAKSEFRWVELAIRGWTVQLKVFAVSGPPHPGTRILREQVLKGVDGLLFVASVDAERGSDNVDARDELDDMIRGAERFAGIAIDDAGGVLVFPVYDTDEREAAERLSEQLRLHQWPLVRWNPSTGEGSGDALKAITNLVLAPAFFD